MDAAPLSHADLLTIRDAVVRTRAREFMPIRAADYEVLVSDLRTEATFRVFGVTIRPCGALAHDEGMIIRFGRKPRPFRFGEVE